jgi:tRNA-2-methylthio-N6-dimethylallyladenosine synthase
MPTARSDTFYLRSFGCQMNDHDSERIAGLLIELGLSRCERPDEATVLIYNSCSIREKADSRLAGHLGTASRLKRSDPRRVVVVAGCLPQSARDSFLSDYPFVDVVVGPQSLHDLPHLLRRQREERRPVSAFQEVTTRWSAELPRSRVAGPCAWVQIAAGCTNFCTYCIVPYVRGPEASRPAGEIIAEVLALASAGVKEVTLLGQNVNAYGKERSFRGSESFADLLETTADIDGIERVRFMTSHPKDVSCALIKLMAMPNKVCEHIHLPAQSGSDTILAAMGRGYTRSSYVELVHRIQEEVPGVAITTDLIVGFPGEKEEDHEATLLLVQECCFDGAFTFIYSPRRQTAAASLPGRVEPHVARRRMEALVEVVQRVARERNEALVGKVEEVLVERASRQKPGEVMGRTRTHKPVNLPSHALPGELVKVELTQATSTSLRGSESNPLRRDER